MLDTGVDDAHPMLKRRVAKHPPGVEGDDDDGHGSHCCGVVLGVAPECEMHSFKVFRGDDVDGEIMRTLQDIETEKYGRFDIVSMSLGAPQPSERMRMRLLQMCAKGIIIVCASGNEGDHLEADAPRFGTMSWPAHYASTIAVGSSNSMGKRSQYSSTGTKMVVMAPGEDVWSAWPGGLTACLSGTSMATPNVAGALALVLHRCDLEGIPRPNMMQCMYILANTSVHMETRGFDFFTGFGRIETYRMVTETVRLLKTAFS